MENIDKIIYINLDKRTDRRSDIEAEFKRLSIPSNKIIRLAAITDEYPNSGCNLSHSKALEIAIDLNLNNVLILEDDFTFIDDIHKISSSITHFFKNILEWDVLLLTKNNNIDTYYDYIISVCLKSTNAAGYIVNRHMFEPLSSAFKISATPLRETKQHWLYQNDIIWQTFMTNNKWFNFAEHLGYQKPSYSYLANKFCDNSTY